MWALGRDLQATGVAMLRRALLAGLALSALVGVLQLVFEVNAGIFAMNSGRAVGPGHEPGLLRRD